MRRKALESDLIIVNHHLFFADLNIKQQAASAPDAGILPEAAAVIFDEAHELEDIASNYFGIGLSHARFDELTRDIEATCARQKGIDQCDREPVRGGERSGEDVFCRAAERRSLSLGAWSFRKRESFLESDGDIYLGTLSALARLETELERVKGVDEVKGLVKRTADVHLHLKFLLESDDKNTVFWIERRASAGVKNLARQAGQQAFTTQLQATPIDVSGLLTGSLFDAYPTVVLTSATLTVANGFEHITQRLGLKEARELIVPSHFDYPRQALLYLPPNMPDPREPDFYPQAAERIRRVLEITQGRAFCAVYQLRSHAPDARAHAAGAAVPDAAAWLGAAPRAAAAVSRYAQRRPVRHQQLLAGRRRAGRAAFVRHHRPPSVCRADRPGCQGAHGSGRAAGGKPFFDLQVPAAVIALKQGFGRLIRSLTTAAC